MPKEYYFEILWLTWAGKGLLKVSATDTCCATDTTLIFFLIV